MKSCSSLEPDQRRFQQARQIEIVLRQQHEARRGQKILDGELLAEVQAVDARHLDALALQGAHQRIDELVAPPHQHHEMAGMQQLAFARALLVADQALGMDGDQVARAVRAAAPARRVGLRGRSCRSRPRGALTSGHSSTRPGCVLAAGQMGHAARLGDAACRFGLAEHPIDGVEHRGRRAERDVELDRHEILHGDAALFGEPLAHLLELARIGALEAEDRLLGVAHGEDRAAALDRALADEEFLGQAADHLPLVGVGVLRFVDQHMVDAAIELVEHPGRTGRALQQARGWPRSGRRSRAPRAAAWRGHSGRRCRGRAAAAPGCARPTPRR